MTERTQDQIELEISVIEQQIDMMHKYENCTTNTKMIIDDNTVNHGLESTLQTNRDIEMKLYKKRAELIGELHAKSINAIPVSMENKDEYIRGEVKYELQFNKEMSEEEKKNKIENNHNLTYVDDYVDYTVVMINV